VLHNLAVDKEEDLNLVLGEVSVDIFIVKFYRRVK
jgi:hypothetical protein